MCVRNVIIIIVSREIGLRFRLARKDLLLPSPTHFIQDLFAKLLEKISGVGVRVTVQIMIILMRFMTCFWFWVCVCLCLVLVF